MAFAPYSKHRVSQMRGVREFPIGYGPPTYSHLRMPLYLRLLYGGRMSPIPLLYESSTYLAECSGGNVSAGRKPKRVTRQDETPTPRVLPYRKRFVPVFCAAARGAVMYFKVARVVYAALGGLGVLPSFSSITSRVFPSAGRLLHIRDATIQALPAPLHASCTPHAMTTQRSVESNLADSLAV